MPKKSSKGKKVEPIIKPDPKVRRVKKIIVGTDQVGRGGRE